MNQDLIDEFLRRLEDRYEAVEIIEILGVDVDTVIDRFFNEILESKELQKSVGINTGD